MSTPIEEIYKNHDNPPLFPDIIVNLIKYIVYKNKTIKRISVIDEIIDIHIKQGGYFVNKATKCINDMDKIKQYVSDKFKHMLNRNNCLIPLGNGYYKWNNNKQFIIDGMLYYNEKKINEEHINEESEEPEQEEPEQEEPEQEEPEQEEPENDEPENDEPENDEPENDEPENDEPEHEEPEHEEPVNEEPINEEPVNEEPVDNKSIIKTILDIPNKEIIYNNDTGVYIYCKDLHWKEKFVKKEAIHVKIGYGQNMSNRMRDQTRTIDVKHIPLIKVYYINKQLESYIHIICKLKNTHSIRNSGAKEWFDISIQELLIILYTTKNIFNINYEIEELYLTLL